MTDPIILDEPVVWPQKGRGGFYRNQHGEAVVAHPDGGKRTLIYEGASSLMEFEVYRGFPEHGERGQLAHDIADLADSGAAITPEIRAEGARLGVSEELQNHIYARWIVFRKELGVTAVHIEQTVVNDALKVASNIDRVDLWPDGWLRVGDTKTAGDVVKLSYLAQLAAYVGSVPYDVDSGKRGEWSSPIDRDVAYIYWFPIYKASKADRADWPEWTLVKVDLQRGHELVEALHAIKNDTSHKDSFTIAAPTPPPVVEQRAGEVERTANAKASPATLDEGSPFDVARTAEEFDEQYGITPTLDELRARVRDWSPADRASLKDELEDRDATDPEIVLDAIQTVEGFHNIQTTPPPRRDTKVTPPPVRSVKPDEGDAIPESSIALIGEAYKALRDDVRSWVTVNGAGVRLSPQHGGVASVRRFEIMRGLIAMARAGFDDDATLRAVCDLAIGEDTQMTFKVPDIVGSITVDEARRFASICVDHIEHGAVSLAFRNDGRAVISRSAA